MLSRNQVARFQILFICAALMTSPASAYQGKKKGDDRSRQEESEDYYQKWLKRDVLYIISDEEKEVFAKLSTEEEKIAFVEQFWVRRDANPRTAINEFKEEHYRRIAYANEKFTSGDPGWRMDRGRIYIMHGPPDQIESRPDGGVYVRPVQEGGGETAVYPFEKWRYRYIEGIGDDVELEFVDSTQTGQYRLAVFPWEKDALTMTGDGKTYAEIWGLASRADRPALMPAAGGAGYGPESMFFRLEDTPFQRYERYANIQGSPELKYPDLKQIVDVNVDYALLKFDSERDYFLLNEGQALVPITVRIRNKELSFEQSGDRMVANWVIYGMVTSMTNRFVTEFEEEVTTSYSTAELEKGLSKSSIFQKVVTVDRKMRYRLDLIIKDLNSEQMGVLRQAIIPPKFSEEDLAGSSLIISDDIQALAKVPDGEEMFVLGDVRILPNPDRSFPERRPLGIYLQVYNARLDQSTLNPALTVAFKLFKGDELLRMAVDQSGESMQFFSARRIVLVKSLSLAGLEPGKYKIQVEVKDEIGDQQIERSNSFEVVQGS